MIDNDRLNLLLDLRRYADAEKAARDAIARNPDWAAAYTHLARALIGQNKGEEAVEAAREGARKAPREAWAVGTLGCALNWVNRTTEALEPAEQAVKLDPTYSWAYAMLANILYNLGRYDDARRTTLDGLKHDPLSESLTRWKAWAEHKLGRQAEALATAEAGLKQHPNSHLLLSLIGCVQWTEAEKLRGWKRVRMHRLADVALVESVRLNPAESAYRENHQANAVSCRRHVLNLVLPAVTLVGVALPVGLISVLAAPVVDGDAKVNPTALVAALVVFVVMCLEAFSPRAALAAPLERLKVPTVPLDPRVRRLGRLELALYGIALLIPYAILIGALWLAR